MDLDYLIRKMEKYADEKGIPIMEKDGINFLSEFVKLNKIKNIRKNKFYIYLIIKPITFFLFSF